MSMVRVHWHILMAHAMHPGSTHWLANSTVDVGRERAHGSECMLPVMIYRMASETSEER